MSKIDYGFVCLRAVPRGFLGGDYMLDKAAPGPCSSRPTDRHYDFEGIRRGMAELKKRLENWLVINKLSIAEQYMRGNLCIVLECENSSKGGTADRKCFSVPKSCGASAEIGERASYFSPITNNDWRKNSAFARVIETMYHVEEMTGPAGKYIKRFKESFDRPDILFYTFKKGYVTGLTTSFGETGLIVWAATGESSQAPHEMVKGDPQIVDSVVYCQGDIGTMFENSGGDVQFPHIYLSDRRIEILPSEGDQLPFDVSDVMIGPLNLV